MCPFMCDRFFEKSSVFDFFTGHTSQNTLEHTHCGHTEGPSPAPPPLPSPVPRKLQDTLRVTGRKIADTPRVTFSGHAPHFTGDAPQLAGHRANITGHRAKHTGHTPEITGHTLQIAGLAQQHYRSHAIQHAIRSDLLDSVPNDRTDCPIDFRFMDLSS